MRYIILILSLLISLNSFGQTENDLIVNSVKKYIDITSSLFSSRFIETPDGVSISYEEYLITQINKQKENTHIKALASFASILTNISKSAAKKYGEENNNIEQTRALYQGYLWMPAWTMNDRNDVINIYLNIIQSVYFHFRVHGIEEFKESENRTYNTFEYITETFTQDQINTNDTDYYTLLVYCHLDFMLALRDYAVYIILNSEKDLADFPFYELADRVNSEITNFQNLNTDDSSYLAELKLSNNKLSKIIVEYFSIINYNLAVLLDYKPNDEKETNEVVEDVVEVPFAIIENVPIFPGCERGNNEKKRKCMSDKIAKFVQRKFNTDLAGDLGLTGRQRISVIFKIDKSGNVTGVRARAPHPKLEEEAIRVISLLPKMKPGLQKGEPVIVPYSLPIIFEVQEEEEPKPQI